ncbi:MAG: OPT/YSL family transporter, partial [Thermoguttaceae bacterium]|nr:OPT/YSL family transporter [Thermoguttaceae bacterium]
PGDDAEYYVWHVDQSQAQAQAIPVGKYLVDGHGRVCYLVDPGITGRLTRRDDGVEVRKYGAPQTELMAMITEGILTRRLPWTLVLLGVFIALVLELVRVPSLPFAVGVYLPFSTSAPVFVGGLVRLMVDRFGPGASRQQSEAEAETAPGTLLSTGYIAGGAIGGVLIAFLNFSDRIPQVLGTVGQRLGWAEGDGLALGTFAALAGFLLLVGFGRILALPPTPKADQREGESQGRLK